MVWPKAVTNAILRYIIFRRSKKHQCSSMRITKSCINLYGSCYWLHFFKNCKASGFFERSPFSWAKKHHDWYGDSLTLKCPYKLWFSPISNSDGHPFFAKKQNPYRNFLLPTYWTKPLLGSVLSGLSIIHQLWFCLLLRTLSVLCSFWGIPMVGTKNDNL